MGGGDDGLGQDGVVAGQGQVVVVDLAVQAGHGHFAGCGLEGAVVTGDHGNRLVAEGQRGVPGGFGLVQGGGCVRCALAGGLGAVGCRRGTPGCGIDAGVERGFADIDGVEQLRGGVRERRHFGH